MPYQGTNSKIQPMLVSLMSRRGALGPSSAQVVISVQSVHCIETVTQFIQDRGGDIVAVRGCDIECKLPHTLTEQVASFNEVVSIRLARLHSMH